VFVDEPQIVDVTVWCAFLRALAIVSQQRNCQVLFSTATLPPLADGLGLGATVIPLVGQVVPAISRYVIRSAAEPWTTDDVARDARRRLAQHGSVAVILNTIRDAVETFDRLAKKDSDWFFLTAMMLPGHKHQIIQTIRDRLDAKKGKQRSGVVCTQVLEAGVDLSFRSLLRAVPVFSSVAQAAGRANRHREGELGEVIVFPFARDDGKDSRRFVYKDRSATSNTDRILLEYPTILEESLADVLGEYYRRCWEQNPHMTSLQWFGEAARGNWSALAGQEPFGGDFPKVDVFVPGAEHYLSENYFPKLTKYGAQSAEQLLDLYVDRNFRRGLAFHERKQLSALLRQFTVAVPKNIAGRFANQDSECEWLWRLDDRASYSDRTGLAHHLTIDDEAAGLAIV
jgi:hypothetical protein